MEAMVIRLEAIAVWFEAITIAISLQAILIWLEAIALSLGYDMI